MCNTNTNGIANRIREVRDAIAGINSEKALSWEFDPDTDGGAVAETTGMRCDERNQIVRGLETRSDIEVSESVEGPRTWLWIGPA